MENKKDVVTQQPQNSVVDYNDINSVTKLVMTYLGANTNLTQNEIKQFVILCAEHKLNPLKREIYAVKYANKFNIITSYELYTKRADQTGLLDYYQIKIDTDQSGKPTGKGVFIGKRKDMSKELELTFWFKEWNQGQSLWLTKPYFMFEKCILAVGLRRLFPNELGNMPYVNEELWYWNKENEQEIKEHIKQEEVNVGKLLGENNETR